MTKARQFAGFIARESQSLHQQTAVQIVSSQGTAESTDLVSLEEPLEIRIGAPDVEDMTLAITMRTPGHDDELAVGFLLSEGLVQTVEAIVNVEHCRPASSDQGLHNVIRVALASFADFDPALLTRHFYTSSSCGVCGKTSMDAVLGKTPSATAQDLRISAAALQRLPAALEEAQQEFQHTGGIHAAALFTAEGRIVAVREDIGRHNALDKLVGNALLAKQLPLSGHGLLLSGRASFELLQKAAMAGVELVAAIGPPSTLAIDLARESGITLVGFLKSAQFNVYNAPSRIVD